MNFIKTQLFALSIVAVGVCAWTGCKDDDKTSTPTETTEHGNQNPSCLEIMHACHPVDDGLNAAVTACHDKSDDEASTEAACAAEKASCIATCTAVANASDAGDTHDGH